MTRPADTSLAADHEQMEAFRRLDGPTRLRMACEMADEARAITRSGIQHRHPDWTDANVDRELLALMIGRALAARVLAENPLPNDVADRAP